MTQLTRRVKLEHECIDYTSIEKAVYAKVSSDLTKVVVVQDREKWGEAF